jgi:hypothetical protein
MKAKGEILSADLVRSLLDYDPLTGELRWKVRPVELFADSGLQSQAQNAAAWNGRNAGKIAFTTVKAGYLVGRIFDRMYRAHRVIWVIMTGEWPKDEVDHFDLDRGNNRWTNLREADEFQNAQNRGLISSNKHGLKGVSFNKNASKWMAQIQADGVYHYLGLHPTPESAHAAYVDAAMRLHGNFARVA